MLATAFFRGFLERFNERFALPAAKPENLHRPLNVKTDRLNDILCHREQRYVSEQLTMSYDRKQIILERNERSEGLGVKYVDLYEFPDGKLEVQSKGHSLPYRLFSKDQRVTHTAVVENKRFSHALTIIKAQQDVKREPKVQTNSEKIGRWGFATWKNWPHSRRRHWSAGSVNRASAFSVSLSAVKIICSTGSSAEPEK